MKRDPSAMNASGVRRWSLGAALCFFLWSPVAVAQGLRDPTRPPVPTLPTLPSAGVATNGGVSAPNARVLKTLALVNGPLALVERQGRLYVVLDAHLYAEGQSFGAIRIERIRETEVWFRDGVALYKMSRFPNVQRRLAVPVATEFSTPACTASAPSAPSDPSATGLAGVPCAPGPTKAGPKTSHPTR